MVNIANNFPKLYIKENYSCGKIEDMQHIYECEQLNTNSMNNSVQYDRSIWRSIWKKEKT